MTEELANITSMIEAAAATRTVRECRTAMLRSLEAEGKELVENGHGVLADPADTLRRLRDTQAMINTAVEAMTKVEWPQGGEGGHYQRFITERALARIPKPARELTANVGKRELVTARPKA